MSNFYIEHGEGQLFQLIVKQLKNLFHFNKEETDILHRSFTSALDKVKYSFSFSHNKYYKQNGSIYFNPYQSAQYCIFLYWLSYELGIDSKGSCLADRVYYLNKALNSVDIYHQVRLPDVFFLDHPVGSVIGRADYGMCFSFSQNCTVGNNKGIYPVIGKNVTMNSGSSIIGNCTIEDNVILGAGTLIKDQNIPSCSLVFGQSPSLIIKSRPREYFNEMLHSDSKAILQNKKL